MGTRSYKGHIANQDIEKLWEFIEGEFFDNPPDIGFSGIIFYLIHGSSASIFLSLKLFFIPEGTIFFFTYPVAIFYRILPVHISKLIEKKLSSSHTDSTIFVYYGSGRILELYKKRDED